MTQNGTASIVGAPGCNLSARRPHVRAADRLNLQVPSSNHIDVMVNVSASSTLPLCAAGQQTLSISVTLKGVA